MSLREYTTPFVGVTRWLMEKCPQSKAHILAKTHIA